MSGSEVKWEIDAQRARLRCGPLEASIVCGTDGIGCIPEKWDARGTVSNPVLASAGPGDGGEQLGLAELYVRGSDLIATFGRSGPHRLAPQIYWRASFCQAFHAARLELVLSVQTDLLDSVPTWPVSSFVGDATVFHSRSLAQPQFEAITESERSLFRATSSEHLFVFRNASLGVSYAEMVHPSDFVSARITPLYVKSVLFPEHLEKGVIRRGRICGWFLPAENDLETAVALARQFVDEPLPLTA